MMYLTRIYRALIKFGKRKPKFIVFEMITKSKLKQLIKEIIKEHKNLNELSYDVDDELDGSNYGGWLDPNGKFHAVHSEGHEYYAYDILKKLGVNDVKDAYRELYSLGFIRIVFDGLTLFYKNKGYGQSIDPPNQRMMKALKDLAIERGCTRMVNCETNQETTDFQESVLTEQNLIGLKSWWMDTNYKFHIVKFEEHRDWAEAYLKKIGYDNVTNVYKTMYKLGFVRVVEQRFGDDSTLAFEYNRERPLNSKQLKAIKDLAIEEKCNYLVDDTAQREIKLNESVEKEKQVKSFLSQMNDDNMVITVSKEDKRPDASYVQVDGFVNGQNVFSSNPEDLTRWGFKIPSTQQFLTLPRGRYKLGDVKTKLRPSLKEIQQVFQPDGERRWWMDTKGKIYDVSKEGHSGGVLNTLQLNLVLNIMLVNMLIQIFMLLINCYLEPVGFVCCI